MPTCPVCGYPGLEEPPRSPSGGGSYEICPSCGFQFGVDDDDKGITHEEWRARWKEKGNVWSSRGIAAPKGWSATTQLAALSSSQAPRAPKQKKQVAKSPAKKVTRPARKAKPVKPAKKPASKKSARKKR